MRIVLSTLFLSTFSGLVAQPNLSNDSTTIRSIFNEALSNGEAYSTLHSLCKDVGHRLTGSHEADMAVEWGIKTLQAYGFDSVYKMPVTVPHWERGTPESAYMYDSKGERIKLNILALGGSIPTDGTIEADVIEVRALEDLEKLGKDKVEGKIVFYNRAMDPNNVNTFKSYGGCYNQRGYGAIEAAKYGAVGVLVRSLSLKLDFFPHTGSMKYEDGVEKIPAAAVSTRDAVFIKRALMEGPVKVSMTINSEVHPDKESFNVIGEIKGAKYPEKVILIGGHLDSWDVGEGAHDDGAGIVHSIEALRILKSIGYRPNYTIRCVLYMNEENGNRGGITYAARVKESGEEHIAALESDRGGFAPQGFSLDGNANQLKQLRSFEELFKPYRIFFLEKGYSGVDIGPLKNEEIALFGLVPESQRYFDHHHAASDVFEMVNKRELELGAAACASLIYLLDKHGTEYKAP